MAPAANQAPPLQETFQAGVRDYNAARYEVATGEFQSVLQFYPTDELAGSAEFYLGEIAYRQQNYTDAVKAYNAVLEDVYKRQISTRSRTSCTPRAPIRSIKPSICGPTRWFRLAYSPR